MGFSGSNGVSALGVEDPLFTRSSLEPQGNYEAAKELLEKASIVIEQMALKVSETEVKETFVNSGSIQAAYKRLNSLAARF